MLCHCTCEASDIVLTSTPTYAASVRNFGSRAECRIRPVEMDMDLPRLDVSKYQRALDASPCKGISFLKFFSAGENVRAVLIINPHNPLGIVFPVDDVIRLCNWATRNDLVVLVDESFTSCVFGSTNFRSFLTYRHRVIKPENVFYLWSLSKDFGIPGMKISVVQSSCPKLLKSLSRLELIHPVSALAHDAATALLSDFEWLRNFHSLKLARLSDHYEFLVKNLHDIGLEFTPAVAGCFVMIDFRKHLRSQTFEAELSLWKTFCDRGVMLTPGQHVLCPQPGWMRLVFSCSKSELGEGINRLRAFFKLPPEPEVTSVEQEYSFNDDVHISCFVYDFYSHL
ncbi:aminotransferase, class I/II [Ostertagia ostertagi]